MANEAIALGLHHMPVLLVQFFHGLNVSLDYETLRLRARVSPYESLVLVTRHYREVRLVGSRLVCAHTLAGLLVPYIWVSKLLRHGIWLSSYRLVPLSVQCSRWFPRRGCNVVQIQGRRLEVQPSETHWERVPAHTL